MSVFQSVEDCVRFLEDNLNGETKRRVQEALSHQDRLEQKQLYLRERQQTKTLKDLPALVWNEISKNFVHPENTLRFVCLSSSLLRGEIIDDDKKTLRLTGEMVFCILVVRCYLDRSDLKNCASASADLGSFAALSWTHLERAKDAFKIHKMKTVEKFHILAEELLLKQGSNLWEFFIGTEFIIESNVTKNENPPEYKKFWETAHNFLAMFGKFIVNVSLRDTCENGAAEKLHLKIIDTFPRIQVFQTKLGLNENLLRKKISKKYGWNFFTMSSNNLCPISNNFVRIVSKYVGTVAEFHGDGNYIFPIDGGETADFKILDTIKIKRQLADASLLTYFLSAVIPRNEYGCIRKLKLSKTPINDDIVTLISGFNNLRFIVLKPRRLRDFDILHDPPAIASVTSLTLSLTGIRSALPQIFGRMFPKLKHLVVVSRCRRSEVANSFAKLLGGAVELNDTYTVRFHSEKWENNSIFVNAWKLFPSLRTVCHQSMYEYSSDGSTNGTFPMKWVNEFRSKTADGTFHTCISLARTGRLPSFG